MFEFHGKKKYFEVDTTSNCEDDLYLVKIKNKILSDEKYKDLAEYIDKINGVDDLLMLKNRFEDGQMKARNNRDFDYYTNMINQIDELI